MIIPDPLKKTVKIPIRIVGGKAEYFYGGPFPKLRDVTGDLVVPAFSLLEKPFAEECSKEDSSELLPKGTSLMVNVWAEKTGEGLCKDVTTGTLSGNVELRLLEPLRLWHRGTKSSVLGGCMCFIPALKVEATSVNHAYTIISKKFETERRTNTGNVFKKVYCRVQGSWEPLQRLRDKYDAQFEQRFTSNRRQGPGGLTLDDSSAIDQSVLCEDEQGRLVASVDANGLTLDEYEYGDGNAHDSRQTIKTGSMHKVLFDLIKERFTTAVEFDRWLDKKGIAADLREGFPTKTADDWLDEFFAAEGVQNYRSEPRPGPIGAEASLLSSLGDDDQMVIVDEESSKRLDEFLAAGWIHVSSYLKRRPLHPSKPEPRRNIPVRIRLKDFSLSKHQRRVLRKNSDVQMAIEPLVITSEEKELFDRHKSRFDVTPPKSIHHIIPLSGLTEIKKVTVTEGDRLIAVSYLDVGNTSTYSMYAMFEPTIEWRSLGILSILKEIEFSIAQGKEFYYLGFVYDDPSYYDYKKHFRGLELFDWKGNWIRAESSMPSTVKPYKPLTPEQQAASRARLDSLLPSLTSQIDQENKRIREGIDQENKELWLTEDSQTHPNAEQYMKSPERKAKSAALTAEMIERIKQSNEEEPQLRKEHGLDDPSKSATAVIPKFLVYVDDNFHYMDESERYLHGEFETQEEAIQVAKAIVDDFLILGYEEGMTAEKLHEQYRAYGEDPFISPRDEDSPFSAWNYAKSRCEELCTPKNIQTDEPDAKKIAADNVIIGSGNVANDEPEFSSADLLRFDENETIFWPCQRQDVICWLRIEGIFEDKWKILDLWQCFDGDIVTITNRIEDFPSGFALHPLERRGPSAPREISAELVSKSEYVEAPNLWKAKVGDRILWVGEPRTQPQSIKQILGLVEFSENALVARENNKSFSGLDDYLDWATGVSGDKSLPKDLVDCVQNGLKVIKRLGGPGSYSEASWGIG